MEKHFYISIAGQEVEVSDLNLISDNASYAVDRALSELLRMRQTDRGVIPAGYSAENPTTVAGAYPAGVIVPTNAADSQVQIRSFRAVIGSSAFGGGSDPLLGRQGIRSAIYTANEKLQLAAVSGSLNRVDLIYARVDVPVPDAQVTRYIKNASDVVSAQSLSVTESARVTVGIVQGNTTAYGGVLIRPVVPADSGSSYYITLGYVQLQGPTTLTSTVNKFCIQEAFPPLTIAPANGTSRLLPASINARSDMVFAFPFGVSFPLRHRSFIPPSVSGVESRMLAIRVGAAADSTVNPAGNTILDTSIDWRRRIFRMLVAPTTLTNTFAWDPNGGSSSVNPYSGGAGYDAATIPLWFMGESLFTGATGGYGIARFDSNRFPALIPAGSSCSLYVDMSTGNLGCAVSGPATYNLTIWLEASGYYPNM